MWRRLCAVGLLLVGICSHTERAGGSTVRLVRQFTITAEKGTIRFAAFLPELYDKALSDKLESGTTRLLLYRFQLLDSDGDLVTEFLQRVTVKYESLAQVPYYEIRQGKLLWVIKTKAELLARLLRFPPRTPALISFPVSLLSAVVPGRYQLRVVIWLDPFTADELARLNKLFQPLGQYNILKMKLFDNAKFRPRREYYVRSQVFFFAGK